MKSILEIGKNEYDMIIFDMDGVILDTTRQFIDHMKKSIEKYANEHFEEIFPITLKYNPLTLFTLNKVIYNHIARGYWNNASVLLKIPEKYLREAAQELNEEVYKEENIDKFLNPNIIEFLRDLTSTSIKTVLHSANISSNVERIYTHLHKRMPNNNFPFDVVMGGVDKKDPQPLMEICTKNNISSNRCLYIDDMFENSYTPIMTGMNFVLWGSDFTRFNDLSRDLEILRFCDKNTEIRLV